MTRRPFIAAAGRAALMCVAISAASSLPAVERRAQVEGLVTGDGKPLTAVLVSDGRRVVRTDSQGRYRLAVGPDSGPFVFVTTPRGFWTESFYIPMEQATPSGQADFALRRAPQPDRFEFVFITDMHIDNQRYGIPKLQVTFREINGLQPAPALVWAQGDICLQGGAGQPYLECLSRLAAPVRNGAGNHEMILKQANPRAEYHRLLGPTYYSFDFGRAHCIVLDGNRPIPGEDGWKAVHGAVDGSEWEWLQADLAAQPEGRPVIVGVHIPMVSTYPERRGHSPKDAPYWEIANRRQLTDLFTRHKVRLVLQGHMHENERITVGGVEYVASISVSGSWWQGGAGFERGVDGSPRGYRIVTVDGTTVTHRYRSTAESQVDRRGEFVELPDRVLPGKQTAFLFNCYDAPNGSTAVARIDQGDWLPMPPFPAISKTTPDLTMPHHFRLLADTTTLDAGQHTLEARVTWPNGSTVAEKASFSVGDDRRK